MEMLAIQPTELFIFLHGISLVHLPSGNHLQPIVIRVKVLGIKLGVTTKVKHVHGRIPSSRRHTEPVASAIRPYIEQTIKAIALTARIAASLSSLLELTGRLRNYANRNSHRNPWRIILLMIPVLIHFKVPQIDAIGSNWHTIHIVQGA
ncbi:hypothetical protein PsorP6_002141 [Peronosclerospora sorghi]|uniref:Uncharacterized protein n=1 Tax=Peronosclerospora sorghi TaxID=230839 RepID=A0ACC0WRB1_9STRA|nr:hypothetical protein PsorP6_002141 [Peronosclerospora sorghi]